MAATQYVEEFRKASSRVLDWQTKRESLISRPAWGSENFKDSETVIARVFQMTQDLSQLAIDLIEDNDLSVLASSLDAVASNFEQMNGLDTAAMVNNHDQISADLQGHHDEILRIYKQEVAWLTIFAGRMENWISAAKEEYRRTVAAREETEQQLDVATNAAGLAREKAGEAGAAEFTAGYRQQADSAAKSAKLWLWVTAVGFALAFLVTVLFVVLHTLGFPSSPQNAVEAIIYLGWRVGTVGLLFGAALWSGRHFRAHTHNHEVNQHRAICLENMRAFHASVEDQAMKDLVALEFSRAATQGMPTGFISGRADGRTDLSPQVLSVASRQVSSAGPQAQ